MAKKYHPDTNKEDPQAKEKFGQLAEAYEVWSASSSSNISLTIKSFGVNVSSWCDFKE